MLNKRKLFIIIFMIFCFVGIIITTILMVSWKKDVNDNMLTKKELESYINTYEEENLVIDFEELREINSDTVGYLKVANTNVDYVVVKGKDNEYYLNHNFNKESNVSGWIFMNYKNKFDGTDKNLVIFGHDTYDGTMFGSLSNLLKEENIKDKDNRFIDFYTDSGRKRYQIFSIYTIKPEDYYIKTDFGENEFEEFKEKIRERSIYKLDVDLENKNIMTLSTCQQYGVKRLAIHAVEV